MQGQAQQRYDYSSIENVASKSWTGIEMPVVYFGISPTKNISGTVTFWKDKAPAEGAKVTLRSGEVEYYGTTEADGTYSIDVIKHSLVYDMIVSLDGYEDTVVEGISFAEGDVVKDAELLTQEEAGISATDADALKVYGTRGAIVVESPDARRVTVYDLSGRAVRIAEVEAGKTTLDGFNAGIYIVERKKVAVR